MSAKLLLPGLLLAVGGATTLGLAYSAHRRDQVLRAWPSTQATIEASDIVQGSQARFRSQAHNRVPQEPTYNAVEVWMLSVRYGYVAAGKSYEGSRATSNPMVEEVGAFGKGPGSLLQSLHDQLQPGATVSAYYDPADPAQSYLLFVESPRKRKLRGIGVALLGIGVLLVGRSRFLGR